MSFLSLIALAIPASAADRYVYPALQLDDPDRIDWMMVQVACDHATGDAAFGDLKAVCEAWKDLSGPAPALPDLGVLQRAQAAALEEEAGAADGRGVGGLSATRPGVNESDLLIGLTDFLLQRAELELRTWLVQVAFQKVCPGDDSFPFLADTCRVFQSGDVQLLTSGGAPLKAAALGDLRALVRRAAVWLDGKAGLDAGTLHLIGAAGRTLELVLDGAPALDAIAGWTLADAADIPSSPEAEKAASAAFLASTLIAVGHLEGEKLQLPPPQDALDGSALRDLRLAAALEAKRLGRAGAWADPIGAALRALAPDAPHGQTLAPDAPHGQATLRAALASLSRTLPRIQDAVTSLRGAAKSPDPEAARRMAIASLAESSITLVTEAVHTANPPGADEAVAWLRLAAETASALGAGDAGSLWVIVSQAADLLKEELKLDPKVTEGLTRALSLASGLLGAHDSAGVQAALESFAAPLGAWARKHEGPAWSARVQAYVGVVGGTERAVGGTEWAGTVAPFMPVGFEFGGHGKGGVYAGLLVSAIDVGALGRWRIESAADEEADQQSTDGESREHKVRIQQVLAPGAWLTVAPGRAPIAFGFGGSLSPDIVAIGADGPTERTADAFRLGAFVAVDIPLFP